MNDEICSAEIKNEIQDMLNDGYNLEDLPNIEYADVCYFLSLIENMASDYEALSDEHYNNMSTLDKIKSDIAKEIREELQTSLKCSMIGLIYAILDNEASEQETD